MFSYNDEHVKCLGKSSQTDAEQTDCGFPVRTSGKRQCFTGGALSPRGERGQRVPRASGKAGNHRSPVSPDTSPAEHALRPSDIMNHQAGNSLTIPFSSDIGSLLGRHCNHAEVCDAVAFPMSPGYSDLHGIQFDLSRQCSRLVIRRRARAARM